MKVGSRAKILSAMAAVCVLAATLVARGQAGGQAGAQAQAAAPQKELMAEDVYKNIQVFRGVPENQFLATMGFFCGSLSESCEFCHKSEADWAAYAQDNDMKNMARKMVLMMNGINQAYFAGKREVTCYTCHRSSAIPKVTPTFADIYNPNPAPDDPDIITESSPGAPPAGPILDKYLRAIGGVAKVKAITSFVLKGTYEGYSAAEGEKRGIEIYAQAPAQRTTIMHTINGDMTTVYDSRTGWVAEPGRPVPLLALTGLFLDVAKSETELSFPAGIKDAFKNWRVGDDVTIRGKDCYVLYADSSAGAPVKFYFDQTSGLLMRFTRFTDSPVGHYRYETDYSDYRPVGGPMGVKMAYHQVLSWMDGRATITMTTIQTNVKIDDGKFGKPAPAVLATPAR
jgi:Photosynthetic reaction centre cytochrome C subunit